MPLTTINLFRTQRIEQYLVCGPPNTSNACQYRLFLLPVQIAIIEKLVVGLMRIQGN